MQSKNNEIISAVAGSGKTTFLIDDCYNNMPKKMLLTTYTENNTDVLKRRLVKKFGVVPDNIFVQSWYSFLLSDWVKPYANQIFHIDRPPALIPVNERSQRYVKKTEINHYFTDSGDIYSDKVSEFGSYCNKLTEGLNIKRLEEMYDRIYIDEIQDLSAYDLEILTYLFKSKIEIVVVGDSRQNVYDTSPSGFMSKESEDVIAWLKKSFSDIAEYKEKSITQRCSSNICAFVNRLYPDMEFTFFDGSIGVESAPIFYSIDDLSQYIVHQEGNGRSVMVLGNNKGANPGFEHFMNIRISKGSEWDCVVVVMTKKMVDFVTNGVPYDKESEFSRRMLYVAVTRAKKEIAFYTKNTSKKKKSQKLLSDQV